MTKKKKDDIGVLSFSHCISVAEFCGIGLCIYKHK